MYNILGMEKKHIGKILAIENTAVSLCSIAAGLACGILFSKLIYLFLSWAFGTKPPFGIEISPEAVFNHTGTFWNPVCYDYDQQPNEHTSGQAYRTSLWWKYRRKGAEDKVASNDAGRGLPRCRLLHRHYYRIALTALLWFFVAVVLVILGTYCLFIAGSIAILKALKKNKKFYYKPANFTAVSGLIYRMKQNAVGLANICILSTMVLVMVSGTVSLYAGMQDIINNFIPGMSMLPFLMTEPIWIGIK